MERIKEKDEPIEKNITVLTPLKGGVGELETIEEKNKRMYSRWVIYFSMFMQSFGFSLVLTGVFPYMEKLEGENANKKLLGYVVAANPIAQMIFSPIIGWWCNRLKSVRIPSVFCLVLFILGNIWYALLPLHSSGGQFYLMVCRFVVGISSGSITVFRTFLTQATKVSERTSTMSMLSAFQALGFFAGPIIQAMLTLLNEDGIVVFGIELSMFTTAGWIGAIGGLINLFAFHPKLFTENNISEREAKMMLEEKDATKKEITWSEIPPDYFALASIILSFFVVLFSFILLETLAVPVAMDQFGWEQKEAIVKVGITIAISAILTTLCFATVGMLSKIFNERIVLIAFGLVPMIVGRFFFFPYGGELPSRRIFGCETSNGIVYNRTECENSENAWKIVEHGCPTEQNWCSTVPALNVYIVTVGFTICTLGYPYAIALLQTLFSKVIGPRPQGVWMGGLTSVASLSRAVGPLIVSFIYVEYGTLATNGLVTGIMILCLILLLISYKRLVPIKVPSNP